MLNSITNLFRNTAFEKSVQNKVRYLESRILNLNERIQELESQLARLSPLGQPAKKETLREQLSEKAPRSTASRPNDFVRRSTGGYHNRSDDPGASIIFNDSDELSPSKPAAQSDAGSSASKGTGYSGGASHFGHSGHSHSHDSGHSFGGYDAGSGDSGGGFGD